MEADISKIVALLAFCIWMPVCAHAETVYFDTSAAGLNKNVPEWGIDTAWPDYNNMRQSIVSFGGAANVDTIRINFHEFEALEANGTLGPESRAAIDYAAGLAKMAGIKPISLTPDTGAGTHAWYLDPAGGVYSDRYAAMILATAQYLLDQHGLAVDTVEVWNEPDYWGGQPTAAQVREIIAILKNAPLLANAEMMGPSTLGPNTWWYDQIKGSLTQGSTHKLGGSAADYKNFIQHVLANGDAFYNPEIHSMAEMLMGAEYGMHGGIFWADSLNPRGKLVQALDGGKRLGYAENLTTETAAAVYRAADGNVRAYAGGFERQGADTYYRFVCTDRDVYYDGVGPIRQYMIKARGQETQGTYVDIEYGSDAIGLGNSFDGNRWKIVNRQTGQVLQVAGGSTVNGGVVNIAADTGVLYQRWIMTRNNQAYYAVYNANSGLTMDVSGCSMSDNAKVQQWGTADNLCQQWTLESAGDGYFYLLNANSGKYLTGSTAQAYQYGPTGSALQQWQFVIANPAVSGALTAHYEFEGNANDSAGSNHGTVSGSPAYTTGVTGQSIDLDGADDFVTLPAGVAASDDITVAAWIYWDGGGAWQRIFDFGNDTASYMVLTPLSADGTMRFAITTDGNTAEEILDTDPLPVGQWVHLAVTLSANTGILYINGAARVAGQIGLNPSDFNPANNYIGKSQWPDPLFNGRIDDFRIYTYALAAVEIAAIYSSSILDPPANFTCTAVSASQIDLSWDAVPEAIGYKLERSTVSGGPYTSIAGDLTGTTYSDTGLLGNLTYYYVIAAVHDIGPGAYSPEAAVTTLTGLPTPWQGLVRPIPGQIEAEYYDDGGQNVSYYDTTAGNSGGQFSRTYNDVDLFTASDVGGGYAVGNIESGEWLLYTVNSTATAVDIYARVASTQAGGQILVRLNDTLLATVAVPNTGSLTTWATVSVDGITLPAGNNAALKLEFIGSDFRLNWMAFQYQSPYLGYPSVLPGRIHFEDFDTGGQNIAYYDTTTGNVYENYRPAEDVDIMSVTGGFGTYMSPAEWMEYTCTIEPGFYSVIVRHTSNLATQTLTLSDGSGVAATFTLPKTNGWSNWQDTVVSDVYLSGGPEQVLRFTMTVSTGLLDYVDFVRQYNAADLNLSGRVDHEDFSILSSQWLGEPNEPSADIAPEPADNWVDLPDLITLTENWLME